MPQRSSGGGGYLLDERVGIGSVITMDPRVRGNDGLRRKGLPEGEGTCSTSGLASVLSLLWIPAFAGMTGCAAKVFRGGGYLLDERVGTGYSVIPMESRFRGNDGLRRKGLPEGGGYLLDERVGIGCSVFPLGPRVRGDDGEGDMNDCRLTRVALG